MVNISSANNYDSIPGEIKNKLENANSFFSRGYYDYNIAIGKKICYVYDDFRIIPVVISKKFFFRYCYLPTEPFIYELIGTFKERHFLDMLVEWGKEMKFDWIGQSPPSALFDSAPENSISIPFGSYVIDLSLSKDALWSKVHSKHRNVIRNALKHKVSVKVGGKELLADYLIAEKDTMKRSNLPVGTERTYADIWEEFPSQVLLLMAYAEDKVQGGAIIVYNDAMAYYMHGASINEPVTGAMNLLQWELIMYLKSMGVKRYSFVGCRIKEDENSKYHGIQTFKKRFGGELFEGKMFKVIYNRRKYALYKKLISIKTKGVMAEDIIDQEIYKWQ